MSTDLSLLPRLRLSIQLPYIAFTFSTALSIDSPPFRRGSLGPCTATSTTVMPCSTLTQPSAATAEDEDVPEAVCSGWKETLKERSSSGRRPSERRPPSLRKSVCADWPVSAFV